MDWSVLPVPGLSLIKGITWEGSQDLIGWEETRKTMNLTQKYPQIIAHLLLEYNSTAKCRSTALNKITILGASLNHFMTVFVGIFLWAMKSNVNQRMFALCWIIPFHRELPFSQVNYRLSVIFQSGVQGISQITSQAFRRCNNFLLCCMESKWVHFF